MLLHYLGKQEAQKLCEWVNELEFNVPFQHKHGYIRDKKEIVSFHLNAAWFLPKNTKKIVKISSGQSWTILQELFRVG